MDGFLKKTFRMEGIRYLSKFFLNFFIPTYKVFKVISRHLTVFSDKKVQMTWHRKSNAIDHVYVGLVYNEP